MNSSCLTSKRVDTSVVPEPFTLNLIGHLSVMLYQDCRPNHLETARLQKGLVLMLDGEELIEEGIGFGVPVVRYEDRTFFSSVAELDVFNYSSCKEIEKVYRMDTISRKQFSNGYHINDWLYSFARKKFEKAYKNNKNISPFFNKLMELRNEARIQTEFVRVKSRGSVTVRYQCNLTGINVKVDFSGMSLNNYQELLVLNEQGSSVFSKYVDSSGSVLVGKMIGAWDAVTADEAALLSESGHVGFSVRNSKGAHLYRGWEKTKNRFSWAGLSYSLKPGSKVFEYSIALRYRS